MCLTHHAIVAAGVYEWFVSLPPQLRYLPFVLFFAGTYFLIVLLVRWHILAHITRNRLKAEVEVVRSGLIVEGWREGEEGLPPPTDAAEVPPAAAARRRNILYAADRLLREVEKIRREWKLLEFIFWSRGREPLGLSYVRDAGRLLWQLRTAEEVYEHLDVLACGLRRSGGRDLLKLAERLEGARNSGSEASARALLQEALEARDAQEISDLAYTVGWHNKAMWMTTTALLLTTALALVVPDPHPRLFIAGAIGGFLSRMMRMLKQAREDRWTNDKRSFIYSESWVTLFISPLVGALAGWTGVLLIIVSNTAMINDAKFPDVSNNTYALGLAILLGFSERFFDRIVSRMEDQPAQGTAPETATAKRGGPQPEHAGS